MGLLDLYPIRKLLALERKLTEHPNQFVVMQFLSIIFAIRYDSPASVTRRVWNGFRFLLMMHFCSYCYKVYLTITNWNYSFPSARILTLSWLIIWALVRALIFDRKVIGLLEPFLNDRSFRGREHKISQARKKLQRSNNRSLMIITGAIVCQALWFVMSGVALQPEYALIFRGQPMGTPSLQIIFACITCWWYMMYMLVSAFVYAILKVFCLEMAILVQSFKNINEHLDHFHPFLINIFPKKSDIAQEKICWDELNEHLKKCIQRHVELLENLSKFFTILTPFCFIQYYGTFVLIAISCVILSFQDGNAWYFFISIIFMGLLTLESYVLYRSIDKLNELHLNVATTLYNLDWHSRLRYTKRFASNYRHVRLNLLIVMLRAQTPFRLQIAGQGTFSMYRFAELIKSTYSMVTLLLQLKANTGTK